MNFSDKGRKLIELYAQMANSGYNRSDGQKVESAYNDFEMRAFRDVVKPVLKEAGIRTLLDYGCGGSDWDAPGFDPESKLSARELFGLEQVLLYEPARDLDQRQTVDCVSCFDVLEHIFISDIPTVLHDIFSYAEKLVLLNVACYPAAALLPTGENAHITVRKPDWWRGMVDSVALNYPRVQVALYCSTAWRQVTRYKMFSAGEWQAQEGFVTT